MTHCNPHCGSCGEQPHRRQQGAGGAGGKGGKGGKGRGGGMDMTCAEYAASMKGMFIIKYFSLYSYCVQCEDFAILTF